MEDAGLQVETILKFNRVTRPAWFFNGKILKKRTFGRFQLWVFDHLVWLWRRLDPLLPWPPDFPYRHRRKATSLSGRDTPARCCSVEICNA